MKTKELHYIAWHDEPHWLANIVLGSKNLPYQVKADWNNRNESWAITIMQDENIIIQGVKLVLDVDLLALATSRAKPNCMLIPTSENSRIERITFENMVNHDVKLYHILLED